MADGPHVVLLKAGLQWVGCDPPNPRQVRCRRCGTTALRHREPGSRAVDCFSCGARGAADWVHPEPERPPPAELPKDPDGRPVPF